MKKFFALVTVLLIFLSLIPAASAAGSISWKGPDTVRAGDTITLTFSAGGGVFGGSGSVSYDSGQLTLQKYTASIGGDWEVDFGKDTFLFYNNKMDVQLTGNTAIFKVSFVVNKNLEEGTEIAVSVKGVKLSDGDQDISMGSKTYSVKLAPPLSGNCTLESMTVSNAKISPAFSPNVTSYTASVPFTTEEVKVSAKAEHPGAKVTVKSPTLTPGGTTTVSVTVKAENGATKTYSIKVTRAQDPNYVPSGNTNLQELLVDGAQLSPGFSPDVTEYRVWLPYETEAVTLLATAEDEKASVEIGEATGLKPGEVTDAVVTVTAENGSKREYTIKIFRAPAHEDVEGFLQGDRPVEEPTAPVEPEPAQPQEPTMLQWGILAGAGVICVILGLLLGLLIGKSRANRIDEEKWV